MNWKLLIVAVAFAASIFVSAFLSRMTYNTDFPAFYSAASTILDPIDSPRDVYRDDLDKRYPVPERKEVKTLFIYSLPVAFILPPEPCLPLRRFSSFSLLPSHSFWEFETGGFSLDLQQSSGHPFFFPAPRYGFRPFGIWARRKPLFMFG